MFKLAKNIVNKSLIVSKAVLEKIEKLFLYHWIIVLKAMFILILLLNYCSIEKKSCKKDLIWPIGVSSFIIIFILLTKLMEIQV